MPAAKKKTVKPGMVNRQAVGTYKGKLHQRQSGKYGTGKVEKGKREGAKSVEQDEQAQGKKNDIQCVGDVVDVSSLTPDPMNARLHPERNLQAIMESLARYGQRSPLVVRKQDRMIAAGNGRLEAMKMLGWTKCAVSMRPMTDAEFLGFALADNRTAELAKWDFEVVARLDALLSSSGGTMLGWSKDELEVLRKSNWVEPPIDFPEVDENIDVEHVCPKCGYAFSGGEVRPAGSGGGDAAEEE